MICLPKTKTLVAPLDRGITSATKNKPAFKMSDIVNKTGVPISVGHLLFTRSLAFEFDEFGRGLAGCLLLPISFNTFNTTI